MWQQSLKKTAQDSWRHRCPNKELVTGIFRLNYVIKGHARIFHLSFLTPAALFREHCLKDSLTSSAFFTSYFLNTSVFLFSCSILHSSLDSVIIMIPTGNNSRETSRIKNSTIKRQKYPIPVMNRMIINSSYAFYTAVGKLPGWHNGRYHAKRNVSINVLYLLSFPYHRSFKGSSALLELDS